MNFFGNTQFFGNKIFFDRNSCGASNGSKKGSFKMKRVGHGMMDKITAAGRRLRGSDDRRADNMYKYVLATEPICPSPFLRKTILMQKRLHGAYCHVA